MKFLPCSVVLFVVLFCCVGVHGGPVNGTITREFSSAFDCKWVMKCAHEMGKEQFYNPCTKWLDPKYECTLKPTVDLSEPPCLVGYVLNEHNKCISILI